MKKIILTLLLILMPILGHADSLLSQLYGGFVGRAKMAIESTTDGNSHPEFLVNYLEIGQVKGGHIAAIDLGVSGTLPDSGHIEAADWNVGAKVHLASLIKSYVNLPAEWEFIGNLEIDGRYSYNFREHHPFVGLVAAYPFK